MARTVTIYMCVFMNTMHAQVYMVTRTHIHKYDQICKFTYSTLFPMPFKHGSAFSQHNTNGIDDTITNTVDYIFDNERPIPNEERMLLKNYQLPTVSS